VVANLKRTVDDAAVDRAQLLAASNLIGQLFETVELMKPELNMATAEVKVGGLEMMFGSCKHACMYAILAPEVAVNAVQQCQCCTLACMHGRQHRACDATHIMCLHPTAHMGAGRRLWAWHGV
jgi:hypothetical protein